MRLQCEFYHVSRFQWDCNLPTFRYGSDTGKGADWHPTRAFHMLRGEAIAWLYGLVLFETVHMVEKALKTTSADKLRTGEWCFSC